MNKQWKRLTALALACMLCAATGSAAVAAGNENKSKSDFNERVICIDPGHQKKSNNAKEAVAPGSKTKKAKVSSGTQGVATKKPEYVVNLEVSLLLKKKLEHEGYRVVMTRDKHDVNMSNKERAAFCNEAKADLAVRIHADGDAKESTSGFSVLYPKSESYTKAIAAASKQAASSIEKSLKNSTGSKSRGIVQRGDLTGFNWSAVPVVVVEMGFMTNKKEDKLLSDVKYQEKLSEGMFAGIKQYISNLRTS